MVIFDLDGTLTVPILNFDLIRAEVGLPPGPILESLALLSEPLRAHAEEILHRHEHRAAHESVLQPNAKRTIATLRGTGWHVAILTRNAAKWTRVVLDKHGIDVDGLWTRDDGVIKPSPEPILRLCEKAGCDPNAGWMVGDHLFDLQSGRAAGCTTVLMVGDGPRPDYTSQADHVIEDLWTLVELVGRPSPQPPA
jgi:HAD superfamily hydrolase (TIGR01662 family)